jgi:hypothetical protein
LSKRFQSRVLWLLFGCGSLALNRVSGNWRKSDETPHSRGGAVTLAKALIMSGCQVFFIALFVDDFLEVGRPQRLFLSAMFVAAELIIWGIFFLAIY